MSLFLSNEITSVTKLRSHEAEDTLAGTEMSCAINDRLSRAAKTTMLWSVFSIYDIALTMSLLSANVAHKKSESNETYEREGLTK